MLKRISFLVFTLLLFFVMIPSVIALAASELEVGISVGLDGKAKYGKGAPLTLTIENSGDDFVGDLVVDISHSSSMGMGEVFPIAISNGETKTVTIMIARMDDNSNINNVTPSKTIHFYEGGWRKGKEVSHKGAQNITSTLFYEDSKFIMTFSTNADRLRALTNASIVNSQNIQYVNAAKMSGAKLPDNSIGWGAADFIVMDEYPIADLPKKKQEALLEWVREGGIFIVGASDNIEVEAGVFSEHLPLQLKENATMDASILNGWIGDQRFTGMIPSFNTYAQKDATVLLQDNRNVLVSSKELGKGLIIQTSFSIGDDPLVQMDGMTALWNRILEEGNKVIQRTFLIQQNMGNSDPLDALVYTIGSANELFPSFKVSTPLLFGIIIIYMIIIIPILYFILKRKDKRESAWWIIPVIAVLTSLSIFAYGAKDRMGRVQVQHSAVVNIDKDGSAEGYFAESVLSNKSGAFTFKAPTGTRMLATTQNVLFNSPSTLFHESVITESDATGTALHLRDVGFWSVATVYGEVKHKDVGKYETQLQVENKRLKGSILNGFPFGLKDVSIWSGTTLIPLGDLGPGETIVVDEILNTPTLLPKQPLFNAMASNQAVKDMDDLTNMRKESLLTFSGEQLYMSRNPVLIGFADTQVIPVKLDKLQSAISSQTLVMQAIQTELIVNGSVTVEPEMMESTLVADTAQMQPQPIGYLNDQYYFNTGSYLQTWQLPNNLMNDKMVWSKMNVNRLNKQMFDTRIFNVKTGLFEEVKTDILEISTNVDDYISLDGQIIIEMTFRNRLDGNEAKAPELRLTGGVAK